MERVFTRSRDGRTCEARGISRECRRPPIGSGGIPNRDTPIRGTVIRVPAEVLEFAGCGGAHIV